MSSAAPAHGSDETFDEHAWTSLGLDHMKLAFWTFLGSDCFFFGSLIGVYMYYRGQSLVGPYPRDVFDVAVTSVSTGLLLLSSFFMVLAVLMAKTAHEGSEAQQANRRRWTVIWLLATALCGAAFVGFQMYEFNHFYHAGLTLQGNLFGSTFYVLTGFHGTHVALGVLWLLLSAFWYGKGWIRGDEGNAIEVAGLYWHFVDVVWIIIFTFVYLVEFVA